MNVASEQDYQAELDFVIDYYGDDFDVSLLKTHLEIFSASIKSEKNPMLSDIIEFFKSKNTFQQDFLL